MALNQSIVNRQYSPTGVNFPDGLRVGSFNMGGTNTVGLGVPVGNTQVYSIKPVNAGKLTNDKIVLNNNYLPLNNQPFLIPGAATIVNNGLKLDVPRVVGVYADDDFSCRMSCIDRYGQKQVFEGDAETEGDEYVFFPAQGEYIITSIYLYNMLNTTTTQFYLQITNSFDLPYSDLGYGQTVGDKSRILSINLDGTPLIQIETETVAPYGAFWKGVIEPATLEQSQNSTTRPQFIYENPDLGDKVLTIQQAVDQYGWTFNGNRFTSNVNNYENKLSAVIGPTPYSFGWTEWQG